jgi:hypothetical protein
MGRVTSTNYTDDPFEYTTAVDDAYEREELQGLALAVETHDHANTRGLAVARIANGAVDLAAKIADGIITAAKIADGVLTSAKLDATFLATLATLTGSQTLTNKTIASGVFTGLSDFQGMLLQKQGANIASATSFALGSDGNVFKITGTATITTITIRPAGTVVVLWFTSTAKVRTGGNILVSQGIFDGVANAVLVLVSDGTNWVEAARAGTGPITLTGSKTWNPASLDPANSDDTTVTVTGAALGDTAVPSLTTLTTGTWQFNAYVISANTVEVVLRNDGGSTVNIDEGTLRVKVDHYA